MALPEAGDVLSFWFGALDQGEPTPETEARWFRGGDAFDAEIAERFGALIDEALGGGLREWEREARGRLALVIVLDQFTRNARRDTAESFAGDRRALALALDALAAGMDAALHPCEAYFLLMPLMHAESMPEQERCVAEFAARAETCEGADRERFARGREFASKHLAVIARFGRFPSRNAALGRLTTEAEREFMDEHGAGF